MPVSNDELKGLYYYLNLVRISDERCRRLFKQGRFHGTYFSAVGQEATVVGPCYGLRPEDTIGIQHREMGAAITKGMPLKYILAELFARKEAFIPGIGRVLYERVMEPSIWKPYPDAEPTLRALHDRGVKIGVVSNHAYDLRPVFRDAGLDRYIDAYALSYEIGVTKPGRGIFIEACQLLGVEPADTLMVGDDATSDGGATEAGLRFYLLGPYGRGGERGLARVVEIVDASRAVDA